MSLFNTSLTAQLLTAMNHAQQQQQQALLRLSTGLRINSSSDDPAGVIALTALQAQSAALTAASENAQRADTLLATADAALAEVSALLTEIETLTTEVANDAALSDEEKGAIQIAIDAAVSSIDNMLQATEFNDTRLFGGRLAYRTSGVTASEVTDVAVYGAPPLASSTSVRIEMTDSAERAQLTYSGAGLASGNDVELQVTGNTGTATLSLAASATIAEIASAANANVDSTGASAVASSGHLYFHSTQYGSDQFVSVEALEGDFDLVEGSTTDYGVDASVMVNGASASVDGIRVRAAANGLSLAFELTESFNQSAGTSSFTITGGGATFMVGANASGLIGVGIPQLSSGRLGSASLGYLATLTTGGSHAVATDPSGAQAIAERAAGQVATLRAQIGATQTYVIDAASSNLDSMLEHTTRGISLIGDADYAEVVADLVRSQILSSAATSALAITAGNSLGLIDLLM